MQIISVKLLAVSLIWVLSIVFALLPFPLRNFAHAPKILSLANAFSGGVFLGAGFNHLLPEAEIGWSSFSWNPNLPLAHSICVLAFLAVFFIEKILFNNDSEASQILTPQSSLSRINEEEQSLLHHHHHHHHHHDRKASFLIPFLMTFVLSIHSIIVGVTIGFQEVPSEVWSIFIAVVAHKWTESFALGVTLARSHSSLLYALRYLLPYTFMVPLGILIGSVLTEFVKGTAWAITECSLESIAGGTFIYIALVDILLPEFSVREDRGPKFLLALLGYAVLSVAIYFFDRTSKR